MFILQQFNLNKLKKKNNPRKKALPFNGRAFFSILLVVPSTLKTVIIISLGEDVIMARRRNAKPDDRSDNVEKLQSMVQNTLENIEAAEETAAFAGPEERAKIEAKNKRRKEAVRGLREEIKDEAAARERGEC